MKVKKQVVLSATQVFTAIWNHILEMDKIRAEKKEKPPKDLRLRYAITKNIRLMEGEMKDIKTSGYDAFETKRITTIREHAKKDAEGQIITDNGNMVLENVDELNKKLEALQTEYADLFKFLDEECEIEPFLISVETLEDIEMSLGPQDLAVIDIFIKE
jgi:hypothetical protein